jgi:hypothetical protein
MREYATPRQIISTVYLCSVQSAEAIDISQVLRDITFFVQLSAGIGNTKEEEKKGLENDGECSVCGEEGVALKDNRTGVEEMGFREREVERRMNGVGVWVGGLLRGNSDCGVLVDEVDGGRRGKRGCRLV